MQYRARPASWPRFDAGMGPAGGVGRGVVLGFSSPLTEGESLPEPFANFLKVVFGGENFWDIWGVGVYLGGVCRRSFNW